LLGAPCINYLTYLLTYLLTYSSFHFLLTENEPKNEPICVLWSIDFATESSLRCFLLYASDEFSGSFCVIFHQSCRVPWVFTLHTGETFYGRAVPSCSVLW